MKKKKKKLFQIEADSSGVEISRRKYNVLLAMFTMYGFVANIIEYLFLKDFFLSLNPIALLIGYLIIGIAGCIVAGVSKTAIGAFIGYNMLVLPLGAVLSNTLCSVLETSPDAVLYVFIGTVSITVVMLILSILNPHIFLKTGKTIFWIFLAIVLTELLMLLIWGTHLVLFSYIMIAIMGFFIAYDFVLANRVKPTVRNAIVFGVNLYLDMVSIFIDLLDIFSDS